MNHQKSFKNFTIFLKTYKKFMQNSLGKRGGLSVYKKYFPVPETQNFFFIVFDWSFFYVFSDLIETSDFW